MTLDWAIVHTALITKARETKQEIRWTPSKLKNLYCTQYHRACGQTRLEDGKDTWKPVSQEAPGTHKEVSQLRYESYGS